jgi:hypothetical protein
VIGVVFLLEEDIGGFEVAVDDLVGVSEAHALEDIIKEREDILSG